MRVAVVIPCYRVRAQVLDVLSGIGPEVSRIFVVDDACPERSGELVRERSQDPRVVVISHAENQGVGGATISGYQAALDDGADVVVKIDGDGQMDPSLIPRFVAPLAAFEVDYAKGNRFYDLGYLQGMPRARMIGNALVSLVAKIACGYWNVMDPTNGFTAIHRAALCALPLDKLDRRYFFESDMLFRLYAVRAVVRDVPMRARYGGETSGLRISHVLAEFPAKYLSRAFKRLFYAYLLRDFNAGTLQLVLGGIATVSGVAYGALRWAHSIESGIAATSGEVMLAALPLLVGVQLLLGALNFDVQNVPRDPLSRNPSLDDDAPANHALPHEAPRLNQRAVERTDATT
ncbi:MAG TPA: glycosyltransferase family 2 protein [Casimicrobiaceae bacterium]|nr:glycosyltransferase family 2 protein [Casimicrobiaceae bacterium]